MPAVDGVPTTNKFITDADLLEKLTVLQLFKNIPEFCKSKVHYRVQNSQSFVPTLNQINPVNSPTLSVKDTF